MEMASSAANGSGNTTSRSVVVGNTLPSLFVSDHNGGSSIVSGKDLDGLIAMNDSALSQQIEFILQEAPMEQDDNDVTDHMDDDGSATIETASSGNSNPTIKLQNPPNIIVSSASDFSRAHVGSDVAATIASTQTMAQHHHLLNGRRIIIQTTQASNMIKEEEADPELNDENLQDIEEEEQAAEAEENQLRLQHTDIKLEHSENTEQEFIRTGINYISTPAITTHHSHLAGGQTQQIVLPAGSIVGTATGRTLTVPVSEALAQLQRRPVYISNAMGGMAGATFVRMPAVIRSSPMTVLNVVQQGVPGSGPTQLILQATPVSTTGTPMTVVTSTTSAAVTMPSLPPATAGSADVVVATPTPATMPALTSVTTQSLSPSTSSSSPLSSSGHVGSSTVVATKTATAVSTAKSNATHSTSNGSGNTNATSTNNNPVTYQCVECVEEFESKELFDIHRSGHANNMKCAICNMVLKSLKNYEKHCLRCKPYECQICGRVVRFRPNFIKHMRVHTGQQSERHKYKCDVCHKEFMSFEYFKVHKKIHNENVNLTCEICGKVFSALASLRGHSKLHSGVKLHKCDVCGKGFGQRYNLKIHARTHTGDFPFECKVCKKKLHTQSSLQTHMQVHQRDQTSQVTTTIKYDKNATNTTASSSTTSTIVKLEAQANDDGPSTSGMQRHLQKQLLEDMEDDNSGMSDSIQDCGSSSRIVSTSSLTSAGHSLLTTTAEDSSNESSNASHELKQQQLQQQSLLVTPTRTIVIKNYMQNDQSVGLSQPQSQHQTHVIQSSNASASSTLQQQLLRKTPIIHSTGGAGTLSSALASVVQQTGTSPSPSPSSSSTSCSSSVVVSKSGAPLSLASAAIGTSTIRSTRNHQSQFNSSISSSSSHHRALQRSNNHRSHHNSHRRRHTTHLDDDDDDDLDGFVDSSHSHHRSMRVNGQHFDDDDDDEKSSPSLATTAIIKVEPNLYSSGSGDNSNEMLIKEEVMFEDSAAPHSPHSPPSSKFRMSNFDSDLVDHNVDLNHSLPPYGNLFDPHSIPDTIPVQLYPDDDDDFRLDHSSLGPLHQTSSSTTDGDFIKKEWVYGAGSSYTMNGKFGDDSDALCDSANFIYD
ncbi:uncharacterized protein LOC129238297 [Anastrepha obliqua]|uniref:uncharacterized protein LOC129238297 n=1 Tax=Anastrepha obliqua TaxID=95512 RepID=UPI0024092616|nr:uncharacterized protein LOC129238297 [Anastrepha obliqua]XP_054729311.1 uncharacterized protein LOC129238297 [Anastrepha obliqua]XP_054729312.1 uncharacterized protein LOC129238297 [Anastrepha obliqua]XP_054729313.1 uncharacterized protein LOC129238297 [Anastrepha obliqua]XP_054729314.1 uncharacterized protein LOC129238297 [Anastrepha obliqua]XP_054729315.1 uncharacterized protein LOC129238297 [Anastrepha obliqua]XP_054729316.1 uncharacterized protein LOC129238297 [Anastrepha obliqua]